MHAIAKITAIAIFNYVFLFGAIFKIGSAALLPLSDARGDAGKAVAMEAFQVMEYRLRGSPLVVVVHSSRVSSGLSAFLTLLNANSDSALIILEGRFGEWGSKPNDLVRKIVKQVIFWIYGNSQFQYLLKRTTDDERWSPRATHYIVMQSPMDKNGWTIEEIFRETWKNSIVDIYVLIPKWSNDSQVLHLEVVTHFPFAGGKACGRNPGEVKTVAVWHDHKFIEGNVACIFPLKLRNLNGCPLRITTINYPPFTILKVGNNTDFADDIDGLHGLVLKEASRKMNFSTEIAIFHPLRHQSTHNPYNQVYDRLLEDRTDMILGEFILTPERYEITGQGFLHQWDCVTFAVPVLAHNRNKLLTIRSLATLSGWATLLLCILMSCASAWLVSRLRPNPSLSTRETYFSGNDALAAFAGVSLRRPPVTFTARVLFPAICIGGLIATTTIRAHLVSFLSSPDSPPWVPSDITELANSELRVGGPIPFFFLTKNIPNKAIKKLLSRYERTDEEDDGAAVNEMALTGMKLNLRYRMINWTGIRLLKGCPLPLPTIAILHKGSLFLPGLNDLGKGLTSGGFIEKWKDNLRKRPPTPKKKMGTVTGASANITMDDMMGMFVLYGFGLVLSSVVFFMEIIFAAISGRKISISRNVSSKL